MQAKNEKWCKKGIKDVFLCKRALEMIYIAITYTVAEDARWRRSGGKWWIWRGWDIERHVKWTEMIKILRVIHF